MQNEKKKVSIIIITKIHKNVKKYSLQNQCLLVIIDMFVSIFVEKIKKKIVNCYIKKIRHLEGANRWAN